METDELEVLDKRSGTIEGLNAMEGVRRLALRFIKAGGVRAKASRYGELVHARDYTPSILIERDRKDLEDLTRIYEDLTRQHV
jgi:hypothetical protein